MEITQSRLEETARRLLVDMWLDVGRFFSYACRTFGQRYQYMVILTALDDQIASAETSTDHLLPQNVLNEIMIRNVQWVHPQCDVTQYILRDLNDQYQAHKNNRALPIYPQPPAQ